MKFFIATVAATAVSITSAYGETKKPQKMTEAQLDRVYAGSPPLSKTTGLGTGTAFLQGAQSTNATDALANALANSGVPAGQGTKTALGVINR